MIRDWFVDCNGKIHYLDEMSKDNYYLEETEHGWTAVNVGLRTFEGFDVEDLYVLHRGPVPPEYFDV